MGVSIRVNVNPRMLDKAADRAAEILATQAMKDTEQFVPAATGSLSGRTKTEGSKIIYPGPYARFLYHGMVMVDPDTGSPWAKAGATKVLTNRSLVFSQAMHAQAQAEWFEASKALNLDKWLSVYKKAVIANK